MQLADFVYIFTFNMGNLQTIHRVAQNAKSLNFDRIVRDSFEQTKGSINLFNRQYLREGFKVDGTRIGKYQSVPYATKKFLQSSIAGQGYIDLYLSGDFQDGIGTIINSKSFTTLSDDIKSPILELRYGKGIFGLPDKYKPNYVQILAPVILQKTKDAIFAGV